MAADSLEYCDASFAIVCGVASEVAGAARGADEGRDVLRFARHKIQVEG